MFAIVSNFYVHCTVFCVLGMINCWFPSLRCWIL